MVVKNNFVFVFFVCIFSVFPCFAEKSDFDLSYSQFNVYENLGKFEYQNEDENSIIGNIFSSDTNSYSKFIEKGFVVKTNVAYEVETWIPNHSYLLEYSVKGLPLVKFNADIVFKQHFPSLNFSWETAFVDVNNRDNIRGLLAKHKEDDILKSGFNKLKVILDLTNFFGSNQYKYYNPWRPNANVSVYYNRETFRIGITPSFKDLQYCDFDGNIEIFTTDDSLYQYTKFDEIGVDINSNGKMILPAIFALLFIDSRERVNFGFTDLYTTIGPYFSKWQKPYSVSQIVSGGKVSAGENTVYSTKFYSFGAVEKLCYAGEYFYFNNKMNWGLAFAQLTKSRLLIDTSSLVFMQFNIEPEVGLHLPLFNHRCVFSCYASGNWGCMAGIDFSDDDESIFDFSSFINSDLILKASVEMTFFL